MVGGEHLDGLGEQHPLECGLQPALHIYIWGEILKQVPLELPTHNT